jgi:predicted DNA-binding transcriptional regulator AlpA
MSSVHAPIGDAKHRLVTRERIMSHKEWCERSGFSTVTGWRLRREGLGPKVTETSGRRLGIREGDFIAWLDSRPVRTGSRKSK